MLNRIGISYDDMKKIVLEAVSQPDFSQFASAVNYVTDYAEKNLKVQQTNSWRSGTSQYNSTLNEQDSNMVNEIVWDLIIERILTIGSNSANPNWPFLRLTEYGKMTVTSSEPIIHDVDGMLNLLKSSIPNLDSVILMYMGECLNTYRIGGLLASCVMLGCAAEKAISILYCSYTNWLEKKGETKEATKFHEMENRFIAKKFDELTKSINGHKTNIDSKVLDDMDVMIASIFTIIRKNRNNVGHPTGNTINRDELSAWIHVFRVHCIKIYQLIDFFDVN